jgi:hypothetical protein
VYFTSIAFKGDDTIKAKDVVIPHTYAQAMASPQADRWVEAMKSEAGSASIKPLDEYY